MKTIFFKNKLKFFSLFIFLVLLLMIFFPSFYKAKERAKKSTIRTSLHIMEEKFFKPIVFNLYEYKDNPNWDIIYNNLSNYYNGYEKPPYLDFLYLDRYKYNKNYNELGKIKDMVIPYNVYLRKKDKYIGCVVYKIKNPIYNMYENKKIIVFECILYYIAENGDFLKNENGSYFMVSELLDYEIK